VSRVPWFIKHKPKRVDDVINQDDAKKILIPWIKQWFEGKVPDKKAVLLYGPAGCGKTSLVEAIANEYNLELIELNASDTRSKEGLERVVKTTISLRSLTKRGKLILLDEVDGISPREEYGAVETIVDLISKTMYPIVLTANDPWSQHLKPIRDVSILIQFKRLTEAQVVQGLRRICQAEGIRCDDDSLRELAKRSEGDMRSAINDLQAIGETYGRVTLDLVKAMATYRDREFAPFEALHRLFNADYIFKAKLAISQINIDYDTFIDWINEHIPTYYENLEEIARAYDALSRADVYRGRIIKSGSWDLLSYVMDMMGPGVAFSRLTYKYRWKTYKKPEKIQWITQMKKTREALYSISDKLSKRLLMSRRSVFSEIIPFLRVIFYLNPLKAAKLAHTYGFDEEEIKALSGNRSSDILKHYSALKKK